MTITWIPVYRVGLKESGLDVGACHVVLVVKKVSANAGDLRNVGLIPRSGRSPGGVRDNPLQYSALEDPMDRGAWWATVHGITSSQTRLKRLSMHALPSLAWDSRK